MATMPNDVWFAVRTVVANNENRPWGPHDLKPGQIDYEERVTLRRAAGADAAIELAEREASEYVEDLGGGKTH